MLRVTVLRQGGNNNEVWPGFGCADYMKNKLNTQTETDFELLNKKKKMKKEKLGLSAADWTQGES